MALMASIKSLEPFLIHNWSNKHFHQIFIIQTLNFSLQELFLACFSIKTKARIWKSITRVFISYLSCMISWRIDEKMKNMGLEGKATVSFSFLSFFFFNWTNEEDLAFSPFFSSFIALADCAMPCRHVYYAFYWSNFTPSQWSMHFILIGSFLFLIQP